MKFSRNVDNGPRKERGRVINLDLPKIKIRGLLKLVLITEQQHNRSSFATTSICFALSCPLISIWVGHVNPREWFLKNGTLYWFTKHWNHCISLKVLLQHWHQLNVQQEVFSSFTHPEKQRLRAALWFHVQSGWLTTRVPLSCSEPPSIEFWPIYHSLSELRCSWDTLTCLFFTDLAVFLAVKKGMTDLQQWAVCEETLLQTAAMAFNPHRQASLLLAHQLVGPPLGRHP